MVEIEGTGPAVRRERGRREGVIAHRPKSIEPTLDQSTTSCLRNGRSTIKGSVGPGQVPLAQAHFVLELGHLDQLRPALLPVSRYSANSEALRSTNFEPGPGWNSMLMGDGSCRTGRPVAKQRSAGQEWQDVDRVLLRHPLADRPAPGAGAGPIVQLGQPIAPVSQLERDRDRDHRPDQPISDLAQPVRPDRHQEPGRLTRPTAIIVAR